MCGCNYFPANAAKMVDEGTPPFIDKVHFIVSECNQYAVI